MINNKTLSTRNIDVYNDLVMGRKKNDDDPYTTVRVTKDFVKRIETNKVTENLEDTLRRLLGWEPRSKEEKE